METIRHRPIRIPHRAAPDEEVWALGDIHGRADVLHHLLAAIERTPEIPGRKRVIIQLGDVIDRGDDGLLAIDMLSDAGVCGLLGNHEQMIRMAHNGSGYQAQAWLANGGQPVLAEALGTWWHQHDWKDIPRVVGFERWRWLTGLVTHYRSGDVVLVHAGISPHVSLEDALGSAWDDLRDDSIFWIRHPFLRGWGLQPREVFVCHGHTPADNVGRGDDEVEGGRLNLDLGSYATGGLRAARIVDDVVEIVDVWGDGPDADSRDALRIGRT